jgi:hypothetical protein
MNTAGSLHRPASERPAIHSTQSWTILATVAAALIFSAIVGLELDAVPEPPAKIILGVSLAVFYGAALAAIRPSAPPIPAASRPDPRPQEGRPAADANDDDRPSEDERVRAWRRSRLTALGVPEDVALILAENPSFSHHELKRLLENGCPLGTALRILQPA